MMENFESKLGSIMTYVDGIPFIKMKDALDLAREVDAALAASALTIYELETAASILREEARVSIAEIVAPHPLNPTMEPPLDWQPEGKRILK